MKTLLVAPSILSAALADLKTELRKLADAGADLIHLDVMDGHYVPNLTFGIPVISAIKQSTAIPLDAHLMVTNPSDYLAPLAELGVKMISFHPETDYHPHRLLQSIRSRGISAGIAINPGMPVSAIIELVPFADFVLLMSVNPGFSGQSFIPSTLDKARALRSFIAQHDLPVKLQIDGGINADNIKAVADSGIDIVVSASYIFSGDDCQNRIRSLKYVQ